MGGAWGTLVLVIMCVLGGIASVSHLSLAVAAAGFLLVGIVASWAIGLRPFAVFGLVYSIPFSLTHHLVYRPNTGAADGLTIDLIDIWMIGLLIHYAFQVRAGNVKPVHGLAAFCFPLMFLLVADLLSLANSADIELSIYGILVFI